MKLPPYKCLFTSLFFTTIIMIFMMFVNYIFFIQSHSNEAYPTKKISTNFISMKTTPFLNFKHYLEEYNFIKLNYSLRRLKKNLTIVTGYFNLGSFKKGNDNYFTPQLYKRWMNIFGKIKNSVVAYFDDDEYAEYFTFVRRNFSKDMTKIIKVSRTKLNAFKLEPQIKTIFESEGYPQHYPNTVLPSYSAAMHAKYELIQWAVFRNYFKTKYFCWLDIGLFRDLVISNSLAKEEIFNNNTFSLSIPPNFKSNSIAYTQVRPRLTSISLKEIIYYNMVWIAGCFFVGKADVLLKWTQEYLLMVNYMLKLKLISTDQQVIYFLANEFEKHTPIQVYNSDGKYNNYFHLGYLCKEAGQNDK